jgi:hypothetical protein
MRRRDFIDDLDGVAASWPLAAGAQQAVGKVPRTGFIHANPGENVTAFVQGLHDWRIPRQTARFGLEASGDVGTQAN